MRYAIIERIRHVLLPNIKRYLKAKPELMRFVFLFPTGYLLMIRDMPWDAMLFWIVLNIAVTLVSMIIGYVLKKLRLVGRHNKQPSSASLRSPNCKVHTSEWGLAKRKLLKLRNDEGYADKPRGNWTMRGKPEKKGGGGGEGAPI